MTSLDITIVVLYFILLIAVGLWLGFRRRMKGSAEYFLAGHSLPWWAIGASMIAANISAEQFIGMSGSGFAIGLAVASYEWMAAAALLVVGWFFLPFFIVNGVNTMPEFLNRRYGKGISRVMSVFWLALYVLVNLSSVLYLGGLTLATTAGLTLMQGIALLAGVGLLYSVAGGLRSVAFTDILQVAVLTLGGLAVTYTALTLVGNGSVWEGFLSLMRNAPQHFHTILEKGRYFFEDGCGSRHDVWQDIPGEWGVFGALWIINLYYWGCNQYIIQRALGAPDIRGARRGLLVAAALKLFMPLIVVVPGIAAYVLFQQSAFDSPIVQNLTELHTVQGVPCHVVKPDKAYPTLLGLLPSGLKGLSLAALAAAIVSSVASMANSASTIFTLDLFKCWIKPSASESQLLWVGRTGAALAIIGGATVAPSLEKLPQAFQFIQEYSGFISPGVFAVFLAAMVFRKLWQPAAIGCVVLTVPLSVWLKYQWPEMPFMYRVGIVFLILFCCMGLSSFYGTESSENFRIPDGSFFQGESFFRRGTLLILTVLAVLYAVFW
ncbi:MAG: sodium/solute symporter [Flavobacteriales bacterium]|nr:sodium/solute symporter [Flavobacteriales bacterium]MCX7769009.1 sodium/solute symporter [Flavobacteriales bacterium]MDW8410202.1 sodium/solute symporter [Flavobacteriales bacterium]